MMLFRYRGYPVSNDIMTVNNELERTQKKTAVVHFLRILVVVWRD
jgi:hypothetical protein